MKRVLHWAPVALGVTFLLLIVLMQHDRVLTGKNDFVAFYTGGKLAGTPDLYNADANIRVIEETIGVRMIHTLYLRHPFYAALYAPVAKLPYLWAYAIFTAATLGAFLWFVSKFQKECPALPFFAAFSVPLALAEANGQDPTFLVAAVGASILLTRAGRDFASGAVLSLCILKPHLFLFVALLLLLKKRRQMIFGGVAGTAGLTVLGVAVNGIDSIRGWIDVIRNPWINGDAEGMPNLHGLVAILRAPAWTEVVLMALTVTVFLWLVHKSDSFELLFALALVCGLLANTHAAVSDDLLLVPVMVLVTGATQWVPLRVSSALILTPVPYFLAVAGPPFAALFPAALLVQLALFAPAVALGSRFHSIHNLGMIQTEQLPPMDR
jgi:hypothetical protein